MLSVIIEQCLLSPVHIRLSFQFFLRLSRAGKRARALFTTEKNKTQVRTIERGRGKSAASSAGGISTFFWQISFVRSLQQFGRVLSLKSSRDKISSIAECEKDFQKLFVI